MKLGKIVFFAFLVGAVVSCSFGPRFYYGVPHANSSSRDEIIMTQDLKDLLLANPKPKIVVRIAQPSQAVTRAEQLIMDVNTIEKVLIQNGYTVRDRALLENLMKKESTDYLSIKERIDTDLIIDIVNIRFDIPHKEFRYMDTTTNTVERFYSDEHYIECPLCRLECRITLVDKGQLGGAFTFNVTRCDIHKLKIILNSSKSLMGWEMNDTGPVFPVLTMSMDEEGVRKSIIEYFANRLIWLLSTL